MNGQRFILLLVAVLACLAATSCSFDEKANAAKGCGMCPPGMCFFGFCVAPTDLSPVGDGTGGSGAPNGGSGGHQGSTGGSGQGGVAGGGSGQGGNAGGGSGSGSGGKGSGGSGGNKPPGMCPGGATPQDETCNGEDDDCDGVADEDVVLGSCAANNGGTCGGVLRCQNGESVCDAKAGPSAEVCNGMDDDCDGVVDNDSDLPCYPDGSDGCTKANDGSYDCVGLCKAGISVCENGKPAACADFIAPSDEQCGVAEATDEDCDGQVDDNCPCSGDQTQSCYSGPAFTRRVGSCRAGTQHCVNSVFGPCEGEVTPVAETCENQGADDDCNLVRDDVFLAGFFCTAFGARGACANGAYGCSNGGFVCLPGDPAATETACDGVDEDCDGRIDENFDLQNDERNCGSCGNACASGDLCCAGVCRDVDSDEQHCGTCTGTCNGNSLCCNGACVATNTDQHCGSCDACGGGTTCCDRACVATNTDQHCGGCGGCTGGTTCCNQACVATDTMAHCGGCAACNLDACCGGACVATNSNDHCGSCNGCGDGAACCNDACVPSGPGLCNDCQACPDGQTCCSGACLSPIGDAGVVCP